MKTTNPPRAQLRRAAQSVSSDQLKHVRVAVLQRIHLALAGIEVNRLDGTHENWISQKTMDSDYIGLLQCRDEILGGCDLATTNNPRLFAMRELVLAGIGHILNDGSYVLCEKGAFLRVGPVSLRIDHDATANRVTVQCVQQPGSKKRQSMHIPLVDAPKHKATA